MKKKHFLFIPIITMGIFAISCTNTFDEQFVQEDQQMPTTKSMGDGQYQVLGSTQDAHHRRDSAICRQTGGELGRAV